MQIHKYLAHLATSQNLSPLVGLNNFHEEYVVIGDDTSDIEASEIRSDCSDYVGDLTLSGMEIDFYSDTGASHDLNITVIGNKDMRITKSIPDESVTTPDSVSDIQVNPDRDLHQVHSIDAELVKILDNIAFVAEKINTVQTNNVSSELTNKIQTLIEKISTDRDESSEQFRNLAKESEHCNEAYAIQFNLFNKQMTKVSRDLWVMNMNKNKHINNIGQFYFKFNRCHM